MAFQSTDDSPCGCWSRQKEPIWVSNRYSNLTNDELVRVSKLDSRQVLAVNSNHSYIRHRIGSENFSLKFFAVCRNHLDTFRAFDYVMVSQYSPVRIEDYPRSHPPYRHSLKQTLLNNS